MKVTVKEVLDRGGEIFGLPVLCYEEVYYVARNGLRADEEVCVRAGRLENRIDSEAWKLPANLEVYADGIRILEIDGRLYRVIHVAYPYNMRANQRHRYSQQHIYVHCEVKVEPLIPDKPKEKSRKCNTCNRAPIQGWCLKCKHCPPGDEDNWQAKPGCCDKCGQELKERSD